MSYPLPAKPAVVVGTKVLPLQKSADIEAEQEAADKSVVIETRPAVDKSAVVEAGQLTENPDPYFGLGSPPDGGSAWWVVLGFFNCMFIALGFAYSYGVFVPVYAEEFKISRGYASSGNKARWLLQQWLAPNH